METMTAQHTPGPWVVVTEDYGDEWWFGGEGERQFIIKAGGINIACHGIWAKEPDIEPGEALGAEAEANGQLIAAAPELLEALKEVEEMGRLWPSVQSVMRVAGDAIAEAEARGGSRADGPLLREDPDAKC